MMSKQLSRATANPRHFQMIPDLKIISLYAICRSFDTDYILTNLTSATYLPE